MCEKCGKPLALTAIVDHLENHCAGASGKSSTDPRDESTRETIRNGVESTGRNNNDDDNSNDNNNDDDDDNDDNEDDDDDDDDDDNSNGANYKKNDSSFNPLKDPHLWNLRTHQIWTRKDRKLGLLKPSALP